MSQEKINLIAVDMGYGHQRAAYPLLDIAVGQKIITINNYEGIAAWEKKYWTSSNKTYNQISRLKKWPLVGGLVFSIMDAFQKIQPFYPKRDLSAPTVQERFFYYQVKKGLGKNLIDSLRANGLPFLTTFFVGAYFAEEQNYAGDIYCIITDTDVSRAWVNMDSKNTRVKYLLPNDRVRERFLMYGVKPENLKVTGFPLPKENIGENNEILKQDLANRLSHLDPNGIYHKNYQALIDEHLPVAENIDRPTTITYAVGGAGAQKEIGAQILNGLIDWIKDGRLGLNLIAGNRPEVKDYFDNCLKEAGVADNKNVRVVFNPDKVEYFKEFNQVLRTTDVLWTKPSELSFYAALGLPIIMSPVIGSQEVFNRETLLKSGAGIDSLDLKYVNEWFPDLLKSGRLARAAFDAYLNDNPRGTYNIEALFN
ncbi:MAG: DUF6938 domain-containing protein [Patescibacteria group bacterium]|jgi:hypothetical protein